MKLFIRVSDVLILLFLVIPLCVKAGILSAETELIKRLSALQSFQADFTQVIRDGRDQIIQENRGQIFLQRPGRFCWKVTKPSEQLLIADGKRVWFYDAGLQQVMIQKQRIMSANSPATLLSGSIENLAGQFTVKRLANHAFQLLPKEKDSAFCSIILIFRGNKLHEMRLFDRLEQQTDVQFSEIRENPVLDQQEFHFIMPRNENIEVVTG